MISGHDVANGPVVDLLTVSTYGLSARRCAPLTTVSFSSSDFFAAAMKRRTPTGSVANGFSQKMCFFASTAASKCSGRYPGGVASMTMSTSEFTSFLKASKPTKRCSASTLTRGRDLRVARVLAKRAERGLQLVLEDVRHGDDFDIRVTRERVVDGLCAAPSAANQAGPELVLHLAPQYFGSQDGERGSRCGCEIPACHGAPRFVDWL